MKNIRNPLDSSSDTEDDEHENEPEDKPDKIITPSSSDESSVSSAFSLLSNNSKDSYDDGAEESAFASKSKSSYKLMEENAVDDHDETSKCSISSSSSTSSQSHNSNSNKASVSTADKICNIDNVESKCKTARETSCASGYDESSKSSSTSTMSSSSDFNNLKSLSDAEKNSSKKQRLNSKFGKNSSSTGSSDSDKTDNEEDNTSSMKNTHEKEKTLKKKRSFEDLVDANDKVEEMAENFANEKLSDNAKDTDNIEEKNYDDDNGNVSGDIEIKDHIEENNGTNIKLIDTDSDEEIGSKAQSSTKYKNKRKLIDSESDEDVEPSKLVQPEPVYVLNNAKQLVPEISNSKSRYSELCDPDTDSDEEKQKSTPMVYKKKKSQKQQEKKMTAKEAIEQRREIEAESQRQLRERNVSLPYHKPKQRSLKEFLQNRPKFASALPPIEKAPAALSIKKLTNQLDVISRNFKEREKMIEEFFKSESEEESENDDVVEAETKVNSEEKLVNEEGPKKDEEKLVIAEGPKKVEEKLDNEGKLVNEINLDGIENLEDKKEPKEEILFEKSTENKEDINEKNLVDKESLENEENKKPDDLNPDKVEENVNDDTLKENKEILLELNSDLKMDIDIKTTDESIAKTADKSIAKTTDETIIAKTTDMEIDEESEVSKKNEEPKNKTPVVIKVLQNVTITPKKEVQPKKHRQKAKESEDTEDVSSNFEDFDEENTLECNKSKEYTSNKEITENFEDLPPKNTSAEYAFSITDEEDSMDELTVSNSETKFNSELQPKSKFELLKERLGNTQPRLSGGPNLLIDLDEGVAKPDEVEELKNRFMRHTAKRGHHRHKVEIKIMNVSSQGEILKDKVVVDVEEKEEPPIREKPGVQLKLLKTDLEQQIALQRAEMWKQKVLETKAEESEENGGKSDYEDDYLDDEEEEEFSDAESSDYEQEDDGEEGIEMEMDSDRVKKSVFLDEEADEDEDNENQRNEDNEVRDDEENYNEDGEENEEFNEYLDNLKKAKVKEEKIAETKAEKKKLKRIIMPKDDNEESDIEEEHIKSNPTQFDSTISIEDEDLITAGQITTTRTPHKINATPSNELEFLSPLCTLTGLQSFDGTLKNQSPAVTPNIQMDDLSPLKRQLFQKSSFPETPRKESESVEDLEDICSGEFPDEPTTIDDQIEERNLMDPNDEQPSCTQDLLDLCSGDFSQTTCVDDKLISSEEEKGEEHCEKKKKCLFTLDFETKSDNGIIINADNNRITLDEDQLISEILNEEEMEKFKKKFESPIIPESGTNNVINDVSICGRLHFDDQDDKEDDEEEDEEFTFNRRRSRQTNLLDSDGSDEENIEDDRHEGINLHDEGDSDDQDHAFKDDDEFNHHKIEDNEDYVRNPSEITYDSDENEIVIDKTAQNARKLQINDFFENEAELSESEWGSEDEDERNLDVLEMEEGDQEKFDDRKIKRDLEKIHMKQLLDEDKHKIKVLQELYMEDGDLQGAGRQRQFKWKNIDYAQDEAKDGNSDDDNENVPEDDENNEEEWRKKRYERELFIKSQKSNSSKDEDFCDLSEQPDSQMFKLAQRAIVKSNIAKISTASEVQFKQTFNLNTQRGSFLTRKDEVLARVAEYTKVSDSVISVPKNSRGFLFKSVGNTTSGISDQMLDKKRKAAEGSTPVAIKKLRLTSSSPASTQKGQPDSKKRLFNISKW